MRLITFATFIVMLATTRPGHAQFVVHDPGNFAQSVQIAERTLRELTTLLQQYETIVRMGRGLAGLNAYRVPTIPTASHDSSRFDFARTWLDGLNAGDPLGEAYLSVARRLERPGRLLDALPDAARQVVERAYATVEIVDSVAQLGGHQVALVRGYGNRLQAAIDAFEQDVTSPLAEYHQTTAVLDKIAGGQLIARRQDMATNQLLSHILEQLLARGKRQRDADVAAMNMRLLSLRDGRRAQSLLLKGAGDDLERWRQP